MLVLRSANFPNERRWLAFLRVACPTEKPTCSLAGKTAHSQDRDTTHRPYRLDQQGRGRIALGAHHSLSTARKLTISVFGKEDFSIGPGIVIIL